MKSTKSVNTNGENNNAENLKHLSISTEIKIVEEGDKKREPSSTDMKIFAASYDSFEWRRLSEDFTFLKLFPIDLIAAKKRADELLKNAPKVEVIKKH